MTTRDTHKCQNLHQQCGLSVDMVIKSSLSRKSLDNVTCVMIAFENFQNELFPENKIETKTILKKQNTQKTITNLSTKENINKTIDTDYKKNGFYVDVNTRKEYFRKFSYDK